MLLGLALIRVYHIDDAFTVVESYLQCRVSFVAKSSTLQLDPFHITFEIQPGLSHIIALFEHYGDMLFNSGPPQYLILKTPPSPTNPYLNGWRFTIPPKVVLVDTLYNQVCVNAVYT